MRCLLCRPLLLLLFTLAFRRLRSPLLCCLLLLAFHLLLLVAGCRFLSLPLGLPRPLLRFTLTALLLCALPLNLLLPGLFRSPLLRFTLAGLFLGAFLLDFLFAGQFRSMSLLLCLLATQLLGLQPLLFTPTGDPFNIPLCRLLVGKVCSLPSLLFLLTCKLFTTLPLFLLLLGKHACFPLLRLPASKLRSLLLLMFTLTDSRFFSLSLEGDQIVNLPRIGDRRHGWPGDDTGRGVGTGYQQAGVSARLFGLHHGAAPAIVEDRDVASLFVPGLRAGLPPGYDSSWRFMNRRRHAWPIHSYRFSGDHAAPNRLAGVDVLIDDLHLLDFLMRQFMDARDGGSAIDYAVIIVGIIVLDYGRRVVDASYFGSR